MNINTYIFKAYDIRGKYPEEINENIAYQVGRYFIRLLKKQSKQKKFKIVIGRDVRFSSLNLFKGFVAGLQQEGARAVDLGLIPTPMLYFAVSHYNYDGGVMITASHNPNPYNGIKLVRAKAIPIGGDTGIFWMRDMIIRKPFLEPKVFKIKKILRKNISRDYVDFIFRLAKAKPGEFKGISVALDAGNGTGGEITLKILKKVGVKVYSLCIKPDGSFPNHIPDPLQEKNLKDLKELVKNKKPNFGIALDGDADRIIFVDEKGKAVSGDFISALMAKIILSQMREKFLRPKILYDIRSSNIVPETIRNYGGKPIPSPIGHALIKEKMRKLNIIFGGELSGHYYLGRELFYEVPGFVLLSVLREMRQASISLSALLQELNKYYHTGEINFKVEDKQGIIRKLKKIYSGKGRITEIDGFRVDFKDWWFLVRPSNTEPLLRLVIEAKTKKLLEEKRKGLYNLITRQKGAITI